MDSDDTPSADGDAAGLARLEAELALLTDSLSALKAALTELMDAMQLQVELELGAPQTGDQAVRWN